MMLGVLWGGQPYQAHAQYQEDFADDELILVVKKPPYTLSDGIIAIQRDGNFYLPVVELSELLDFKVDADLQRGVVDGFYLKEDNRFSINAETHEMVNKGKKIALNPSDIIVDEAGGDFGDIYVLMERLNEIWPLTFNVNLYALSLDVDTGVKLPFEEKLERKEKQELIEAKTKGREKEQKKLPFVPNPYRAFGKPALDLDYSAEYDQGNQDFSTKLNLKGTQDLLWAQADYAGSLAYDTEDRIQKPRNLRLTFKRQFFRGEAPLDIKTAEAGDTRVNLSDLVGTSVSGRGVRVSSEPNVKDRSFDQVTIEGRALPGWEVELYRNNQLIKFGTVDNVGEYRFEDVELEIGNNQFRVVLYGPQGQIEERTESYVINGNMMKPGKTVYRLGAVDADHPLILLDDANQNQPKGIATEGYVAHGLTKWLTLFGFANSLPTQNDKQSSYLSVGGMFSGLGGVGQVQIYKQARGGQAGGAQFATKMLGINFNLEGALYKDFESDDAGYGISAKKYETKIRASRNFSTAYGSLGLQMDARQEMRRNGIKTTTISTRQSFSRAGVRLSNSTNTTLQNFIQQNSTGSISATVRIRQWQLRSGLNYNIYPEKQVSSVNAEARYRGDDSFSAAVSLQHNFLTHALSTGAQVSYDFGKFLGSFSTDWDKGKGFVFKLRASTSLGPFDDDSSYMLSSRKLSNEEAVAAKIFLDHNGNGTFDEGDEPLPDTKLLMDGRSTREASDDNGDIVARNSGQSGLTNIEVDTKTLADPYYQPENIGYSTIMRQGGRPHLEFPVIETGSIDGTVTQDKNGNAIPGMTLQLVDKDGKVVKTVETAYDGFYSFEYVPPGTYTVRADPSYKVNVPPMTVSVASDDLFASGIDLALMEQAEEAGAAEKGSKSSDEGADSNGAASGASGRVAQTHHSKGTGQPAPSPSSGNFKAVVKRVRIGEHPDKVRFVLDLSGPASYQLSCKENCAEISVDLPDVAWSAIRHWRAESTPVIESFSTEALANGGSRLTIKARKAMTVGLNGVLGPRGNAGKGYRLYLDVQQ